MTIAYRPKAGRPTRDQARARDVAMLEVALDHFLDLGFERTTIQSVARSVGMAKRTLYARYGDKVALFRAAVGLAIDRFAVSQEELAATARDDVEETLMAFAWLRIEQVMTPNGLKLQRIINAESHRFPDILTESYEFGAGSSVRYLAGVLARETEAGRLAVPAPERAAVVFLSMVVGGPVRTIVIGNPLSRDEIGERLRYAVRLFLDGARARLELEGSGHPGTAHSSTPGAWARMAAHTRDTPPSTWSVCPVTNAAWSDARYTAAAPPASPVCIQRTTTV